MANAKRVGSIDFWRGGVLIAILVDHIPGNLLEFFHSAGTSGFRTAPRHSSFSRGVSVGMVYLPRARKHGLAAVARGCLQRALKLYGVHIALTAAALVDFRRRLLGERRRGPDRGARPVIRLRLASDRAGRARRAQPPARLFQHPAALRRLDAVGAAGAGAGDAQSPPSPSLRRSRSTPPRAASAFTCRTGPSPAAGSSIRSPGSSPSRSDSSAPSSGATGRRARRRAGRRQRRHARLVGASTTTSGAGLAPGLRDAASAHLDLAKQDLGTGAARPLRRARLSHRHRSGPDAGDRRAARPGGAEPGTQRPGDLRRRLDLAPRWVRRRSARPRLIPPSGVEHLAGLAYTLAGVAALFAIARWIECRNTSAPPSADLFAAAAPQPL